MGCLRSRSRDLNKYPLPLPSVKTRPYPPMDVEKVSYAVNWKNFRKGYSFFIPCLKCKTAREMIKKKTRRLKMKVLTKVVVEDGVRGIRVWRL